MARMLGLDIGERRIGVALSDPIGLTAQRLTLLERREPAADRAAIAKLARQHAVEAVVIGLPLMMDGQAGEQAKKIQAFVEALAPELPCPVRWIDERLTTAQGERSMLETDTSRKRRKELIDQIAAQLILQAYLDAQASNA